MELIQTISIILEGLIALVGLALALKKKKAYGWPIAAAYAMYMAYDLMTGIGQTIREAILLIGAVVTLVAVWMIYKQK